jgi:hypothetical protein
MEEDGMTMPKKALAGIALLVIGLVLIIVAVPLLSASRLPTVDGSKLTIRAGGHQIEGVLPSPAAHKFLLKDEGVSLGTFSGDAFVTILPLQTADQLWAQYGDFFKCDEPGAAQAIQSMQATIFVAGNVDAKRELSDAMELVRQSRIPVVSFTGGSLQSVGHTYLGMQVTDPSDMPIYYVTVFKIVKTDYIGQ